MDVQTRHVEQVHQSTLVLHTGVAQATLSARALAARRNEPLQRRRGLVPLVVFGQLLRVLVVVVLCTTTG